MGRWRYGKIDFLLKTVFSLVKSRLVRGQPGWLVGCHHADNGLI